MRAIDSDIPCLEPLSKRKLIEAMVAKAMLPLVVESIDKMSKAYRLIKTREMTTISKGSWPSRDKWMDGYE